MRTNKNKSSMGRLCFALTLALLAVQVMAGPLDDVHALELFSASDLDWRHFPTIHPMIVHIPVVMLPLALLFIILFVSLKQTPWLWASLICASLGLAGGYSAAFIWHPHTIGLPMEALITLKKHDFFAYTTIALTSVTVLLLIAALALTKFRRVFAVLGLVVLANAALCVAVTAHYGGTLAYVHGVGVQGDYLRSH